MDIASKYNQRGQLKFEYSARAFASNQLYIGQAYKNIEELYKRRLKCKREEDELGSQMYKLIMNSAYGQTTLKDYGLNHFIPTGTFRSAHENGPQDLELLLNNIAGEFYNAVPV